MSRGSRVARSLEAAPVVGSTKVCLAVVVLAGCVPDASLTFSWAGDAIARGSAVVDPCPDWSPVGGPTVGVKAVAIVDGVETDASFDCHLGRAVIDVPAGSGTFTLWDVLAGPSWATDSTWVRSFAVAGGETLDLGSWDLYIHLPPPTPGEGGGPGVPDPGGDW